MTLKHISGAAPHLLDATLIVQKFAQDFREVLPPSRLHHRPATMKVDLARKFAVRCRQRDDRPARGGDAVKLARNDEAFKLRLQRHEMHVRHAEGVLQRAALLIGHEAKEVIELALSRLTS